MNLFPKYEKNCLNYPNIEKLNNELVALKKQIDSVKETLNNTQKISKFNDIEENVLGFLNIKERIFTVTLKIKRNNNSSIYEAQFTLYDLKISNSPIYWLSQLTAVAKYTNDKTYIESFLIKDFASNIPNHGYGSLLMTEFLKYASKFSVKEIYGELSFVDEQDEFNKKRRNHFYKKFGFEINEEKRTVQLYGNKIAEIYKNEVFKCWTMDEFISEKIQNERHATVKQLAKNMINLGVNDTDISLITKLSENEINTIKSEI